MSSLDENHFTILRFFQEDAGAGVDAIDISSAGQKRPGVPDIWVGAYGLDQGVETKVPGRVIEKGRLRSTKCGACKHDKKFHVGGVCQSCEKRRKKHLVDASKICGGFVFDIGQRKVKREGKPSQAQKKFHREWRGRPIVIVRTIEEARTLLSAMAEEAFSDPGPEAV